MKNYQYVLVCLFYDDLMISYTNLLYLAIFYLTFTYIRSIIKKWKRPTGSQEVPVVKGGYPLVGHGIAFSKDIIGFVRNSYKQYGKIFRVKIFNRDMVVVCDRDLNKEYFKATEHNMSLYDVLDRLFFSDAFSDDPKSLPTIIKMVKSTVAIKYDEFVPKIVDEANRMISRMKIKANSGSDKISLTDELIRFVACTSAQCFISVELSNEFFDVLMKFTHLLNKIVILTYFFPKKLLRLMFNSKLSKFRKTMTTSLSPVIETYRTDLNKDDSLVFRKCVDYTDPKTGKKLTNEQIGDVVVCLLYVSSENTALGLSATMIDLARCPEFWDKVKSESAKHLATGDIKSLLASPILEACVMESARMNSHIFALNRKPQKSSAMLGKYFIGDADSVALCEPMLMMYDCAEDVFKDAIKYNPSRFLDPINEPKTPMHVMTWGAGVHLCPGKSFAIYEIKVAMALITTNFEKFVMPSKGIKLDYFSPSAFAEQQVTVGIKCLNESELVKSVSSENMHSINHNNKTYKVQYLPQEQEQAGGWLIRDCLTREEQIKFYNYTTELSKGSDEHKEVMHANPATAFPITYYNLVYTGKSNCQEPKLWLNWASDVWSLLKDNHKELKFPVDKVTSQYKFDSVYAQLYGPDSTMKTHKDEYVSYGVSVNLGASCDFLFGNDKLILNSGDVLIADFSKVQHGVPKIHADTVPGWFAPEVTETESVDKIEAFGRIRCSVQIRNVSDCAPQKVITNEEFRKMIMQ